MPGIIFDIKKYAIHDGPGIRTTVFFKGCPLKCQWCHNPESWSFQPELMFLANHCIKCGSCVEFCPQDAISLPGNDYPLTNPQLCRSCGECVQGCPVSARKIVGRQVSAAEVMEEIEKDTVFYDESGGGVTFSGGEPLAQPDFLLELLEKCHQLDIHTAVDSTCYAPRNIIESLIPVTDLFLCDIKIMDSSKHRYYTGLSNEVILDNIRFLARQGCRIILRLPVIAGVNDDQANIEATGRFAAELGTMQRIDVLAYNSSGWDKNNRLINKRNITRYPTHNEHKMLNIVKQLRSYDLQVETGG